MKHSIVILSILFFLSACSTRQSQYPNMTNEQLLADLQWGLNYSTVNKILTEKYTLDFSEEQKQLPPMTVYVYNGGRYNDVEIKSLTVTFYNDSLIYVHLRVFDESPEKREQLYRKLCEINNNEFVIDSDTTITKNAFSDENRWYTERDGKRLSNILISKPKDSRAKEFGILMARGY